MVAVEIGEAVRRILPSPATDMEAAASLPVNAIPAYRDSGATIPLPFVTRVLKRAYVLAAALHPMFPSSPAGRSKTKLLPTGNPDEPAANRSDRGGAGRVGSAGKEPGAVLDRYPELRESYSRVFSGEEDRIPPLVSPPCPSLPNREELVRDTVRAVAKTAAALQGRVAVLTDVNPTTPEQMAAFLARPAVRDVPRRGGPGRVVHTPCESIEAGRRIYGEWRKRPDHRRPSLSTSSK